MPDLGTKTGALMAWAESVPVEEGPGGLEPLRCQQMGQAKVLTMAWRKILEIWGDNRCSPCPGTCSNCAQSAQSS